MTIVFSDVGGTLFEGAPWRHLRKHPAWHRTRGQIEFIKFLPIFLASRVRLASETQMRSYWLRGMAAVFAGMSRVQLEQMYQDTINQRLQYLFRQDVAKRLQAHKAQGDTVVLVSGIFTELIQAIADHLGLDGAIGTQMQFDKNDIATGTLHSQPCVGQHKIMYMQNYLSDHHPDIALSDCFGYADSYSDRALLSAVGQGVATYPDSRTRELAVQHGWEIISN
ncbi:MAG: HAD family hydrolase [Anaerolineae bacterium]